MKWRFWRREHINGVAAARAKAEAEARLREARRDWPKVQRARDELAQWIDTALRGHS
jgi:hypothetical protein